MDAKELGLKIQELRKQKGMTQEDLAEKTGLSVRTIQRIESGEVDPRSYTLNQIAEALGVEITELTKENEKELKLPPASETRKWLTWLHLSGILFLLFPPLIIYVLKKDEIPGMNKHGRAVLNFQISIWLYSFLASLMVFFVGFLMMFLSVFFLLCLFAVIINTVRVANGNSYYYPLSIPFMK